MRAFLRFAVILACFAAAGFIVLPKAWGEREWLFAGDDAVTLTRLGLRVALTSERINAGLKAALDNKEKYLADSFIELAKQENLTVDPALLDYARENGGFTAPIERVVQGLWDGKCSSLEGFAAGKLGDLLIIGDVRDLYNEVDNYRSGKPVNELVLGLAAIGIVSTAAVPIHAAASTIKGLAKAERLAPALRGELLNALKAAVDTQAVVQAVPKFGWWDTLPSIGWNSWRPDLSWPLVTEKLPQLVSALQSGVNLSKLGALNGMTTNVVTIAAAAGVCAAQDALALAQNSADLEKMARLSETRKGATAAVLKVLGRDAFVMPGDRKSGSMMWIGGGVAYLVLGAIALLFAARSVSRR